ncbi:hypothetical protein F2P81_017391 [Scophthalmus maximus]|uniref:Uncharacterized protein n=1 Tax=Scophthalmus maximus TaxID=52904 RepID=A0A6A4SFM8_SCOMX|nr:hypothetical protein F2P81_017391 [Scophthalmus maximus]
MHLSPFGGRQMGAARAWASEQVQQKKRFKSVTKHDEKREKSSVYSPGPLFKLSVSGPGERTGTNESLGCALGERHAEVDLLEGEDAAIAPSLSNTCVLNRKDHNVKDETKKTNLKPRDGGRKRREDVEVEVQTENEQIGERTHFSRAPALSDVFDIDAEPNRSDELQCALDPT